MKNKLTFHFSDKTIKDMDKTGALMGTTSRLFVIEQSIDTIIFLVKHCIDGGRIELVYKDGTKRTMYLE